MLEKMKIRMRLVQLFLISVVSISSYYYFKILYVIGDNIGIYSNFISPFHNATGYNQIYINLFPMIILSLLIILIIFSMIMNVKKSSFFILISFISLAFICSIFLTNKNEELKKIMNDRYTSILKQNKKFENTDNSVLLKNYIEEVNPEMFIKTLSEVDKNLEIDIRKANIILSVSMNSFPEYKNHFINAYKDNFFSIYEYNKIYNLMKKNIIDKKLSNDQIAMLEAVKWTY